MRARGFNGGTFGLLAGDARYRHMPSLGNLAVLDKDGHAIRIKDPTSVHALLDLAVHLAKAKQRVIFFCSCKFPSRGGLPDACHRVTVARLLLEASRDRQIAVKAVEWPGGQPVARDLQVAGEEAQRVRSGAKFIRLGPDSSIGEFAAIPWGSVVRILFKGAAFSVTVGPAQRRSSGWRLPILLQTGSYTDSTESLLAKAQEWREEDGFEPRAS